MPPAYNMPTNPAAAEIRTETESGLGAAIYGARLSIGRVDGARTPSFHGFLGKRDAPLRVEAGRREVMVFGHTPYLSWSGSFVLEAKSRRKYVIKNREPWPVPRMPAVDVFDETATPRTLVGSYLLEGSKPQTAPLPVLSVTR